MEYRLTVDRHPERKYEQWLFLNRGKGRSKMPIVQWMSGIISAHPYHSAHDISIYSSAQLLLPDDSHALYIMVFQVQSQKDQSETSNRCLRIIETSEKSIVEEITLKEAPEAMKVIASV